MRKQKRYSRLRKTRRGSYEWNRPNGETVRLRNFSEKQIHAASPAFVATDFHLKPEHVLHASIQNSYGTIGKLTDKAYGGRTAGLTFPRKRTRSQVFINPKVYSNRNAWNPPGIAAHEIAHLVGPGNRSNFKPNPQQIKDFKEAFGYKQARWGNPLDYGKGGPYKKKRGHPLANKHTRQAHSAEEDFAETYRASIGVPLTTTRANRRQKAYGNVYLNKGRKDFMKKYYLK